jgi:hypothetical protein
MKEAIMERNENTWRDHIASADRPPREAKRGEYCLAQPGMHLLDNEGLPTGVHGKRLLDALKLDGIDAKLVLGEKHG